MKTLQPDPAGLMPGYLVYVAAILVPGLGFGELLRIWKSEDGLAEKFGYVLGLGLAVDTVVFLIKDSGFSFLGTRLLGIDQNVVYFLISSGIVALTVSIASRKSFAFPSRPARADGVLALILLAQVGMVLLILNKYPIFPIYRSQDFWFHASESQMLVSGQLPMVPGGLMYYASAAQVGMAMITVGGLPITVAWNTMAILVCLSPLIVYLAAVKLSADKLVSLLVTALYTLSGTVWYIPVFDSGLYPNFFGILASLVMFVAYVDVTQKDSRVSKWVFFLFALVTFYMSHYSVLVMLPAFLVFPLYQLAKDKSLLRKYVAPTVLILAPAILAVILLPSIVSIILGITQSGGGAFLSQSYFRDLLAGIPVLGFMAGEVNGDIQFLILMILLVVYVARLRPISALLLFPLVWFLTLMFAPFNLIAWRFAFEALIPLLAMAGLAIRSLSNGRRKPGQMKKPRTNISKGWRTAIVVGVFLFLVVADSWTPQLIADATTNTALFSEDQHAIYNATLWMRENTTASSAFLSLTEWHFSYLNSTIGRDTIFKFFSEPGPAIEFAKHIGARYIIVTYVVAISLPNTPNIFPWNNFPGNSSLSLAYSNSLVRIYSVS